MINKTRCCSATILNKKISKNFDCNDAEVVRVFFFERIMFPSSDEL